MLHDLDLPQNRRLPAGIAGESGVAGLGTAARHALRELLETAGDSDEPAFQALVSLTEQELIEEALKMTGDNQVAAAKLLGLNRSTLRKKMGDKARRKNSES
jgi:two-component system nitrogen regulation response regulator GlnG